MGDERQACTRAHRVMLQAWGDATADSIFWMSAHTAEHTVGVKFLGDGSVLTVLGCRGNEQAGKIAICLAEAHMVP